MKRVLKIGGSIIGFIAIIAIIVLIIRAMKRKPQIDIISVDYIGKTVIYKMSAGGVTKSGTAKLGDNGAGGSGAYSLMLESKGNTMTLKIEKDNNTVISKTIDFDKKSIF